MGVNEQNGRRKVLPSQVQDGLFMVWPGKVKPEKSEWFKPPSGYTVHAELVIENVPVDAALLMENLLDLAHAPFTHTGTFAKGWGARYGGVCNEAIEKTGTDGTIWRRF